MDSVNARLLDGGVDPFRGAPPLPSVDVPVAVMIDCIGTVLDTVASWEGHEASKELDALAAPAARVYERRWLKDVWDGLVSHLTPAEAPVLYEAPANLTSIPNAPSLKVGEVLQIVQPYIAEWSRALPPLQCMEVPAGGGAAIASSGATQFGAAAGAGSAGMGGYGTMTAPQPGGVGDTSYLYRPAGQVDMRSALDAVASQSEAARSARLEEQESDKRVRVC